MNNPLVSIIIPTYNRGHLIGETLDSIIAQTYSNWECIVVDDISTDNTEQILLDYLKKDDRIKYFTRPQEMIKGACSCRNYGFQKAIGEYVNWFDSDDLMLEKFIEDKLNHINKKNYDFVINYGAYFENNKNDIEVSISTFNKKEDIVHDFLSGKTYFSTPGPLWRKKYLQNKKLFDVSISKLQDVDFHIRMLLENPEFDVLDKQHYFLIRRGTDRISSKVSLSAQKMKDVFYIYHNLLRNNKLNHLSEAEKVKKTCLHKVLMVYYEIFQRKIKFSFKELVLFFVDTFFALLKVRTSLKQKLYFISFVFCCLFKKGFSLIKKI